MIKKHGHLFWLDLRVGGRRIRRSLKTGERTLAIERARDISRELQDARKDIRISDFAAKYLEWAWSSKPASADREQQRMKKISAFFDALGIVHLSDITPYHIEQLRMKLKEQGQAKTTINRYLQLLRGMFYKAIDWGFYTGQNPVKKVKFYWEDPKVHALSRAEVDRILEAARAIAKRAKSPLQKLFPEAYPACPQHRPPEV